MSKNANSIDVLRIKTAPMHAFRLIWMVFSGFFAWFAYAQLMPVMHGELYSGTTQPILLPIGALLTSFNITA